jgi:hypothetical protein
VKQADPGGRNVSAESGELLPPAARGDRNWTEKWVPLVETPIGLAFDNG